MPDIQDVYGGHEFDCNEVDPQQVNEPLPAGWYPVIIEETEVRETSDSAQRNAGDGYYMKVKYQVVDGQHKGRKVFGNINLRNKSQQAEEIGMRELSAIGRAVGVMNISDSSQIKDKVLQIKLTVKTSEQYGPQNEVKGYKSVEGLSPVAPAGTAQATAAPAAAAAPAKNTPPWKR